MENSIMNIIKISSVCLVLSLLTACNGSSSDANEKAQEKAKVSETFETTKVKFQFNLPAGANLLDTQNFTSDDVLSYNAGAGMSVCEPTGSKINLDVYFAHVEQNKWDVYFKLDDEFLNVDGGEIGGTGQTKATLVFDDEGNFIRQVPYIIKSTDLKFSDKTYKIEFDFYSDPTSNFDGVFDAKKLDANGC